MGKLNCVICGKPHAQCHEIVTRGAGGPREEWNTLLLCADHHTMGPYAFHRIGRYTFAMLYPWVYDKIKEACRRAGKTFRKGKIGEEE